ncbi:hypothetical protein L218DRAFT_348618 [Marasmius fiardii PR-910]|nr:hypothetical protein L218DRAFT_348618 [Marasmius fiardii PR-910]
MDILVSTTSSLVLRYVLSNFLQPTYRPSMIIPVFLGLWEGTWLHMLLSSMPTSYDPYLAYLLRPILDFLISGSISYVFIVVVWSMLTVLALDAMGPEHFHDTRRERDSKRPARMGSSHTVLHTTHLPHSRRRSSSRSLTFVLPVASPESDNPTPSTSQLPSQSSTATSSSSITPRASSSTPDATSPRMVLTPQQQSIQQHPIAPIESPQLYISTQAVIMNPEPPPEPASSPISSFPLLQTPGKHRVELVVPALAEGSRSNFPRSPFPPFTVTSPPITNTGPTPREPEQHTEDQEPDHPIPVPAPGHFPIVALESSPPLLPQIPHQEAQVIPDHPSDEADPLQTPVLRGFDDPVHVDSEVDELTTPPYMRPPLASIPEGGSVIIEEAPSAGPSLLLKALATTTVPSTSNVTANATPVPIPAPGHLQTGSPALSALDILSPASSTSSIGGSIISTTDPKSLFERAEKLRNKAWQEVQEKSRLRAELQQARNEGRKKDIFILVGDLKDCEHRIDTLHARAKRRYYLGDALPLLLGLSTLTMMYL